MAEPARDVFYVDVLIVKVRNFSRGVDFNHVWVSKLSIRSISPPIQLSIVLQDESMHFPKG